MHVWTQFVEAPLARVTGNRLDGTMILVRIRTIQHSEPNDGSAHPIGHEHSCCFLH
jgi:hypothetical protein